MDSLNALEQIPVSGGRIGEGDGQLLTNLARLDRGDITDPGAAAMFERLLMLLDDPDVKKLPALADLRTVAEGFRDLSRAATTTPARQIQMALRWRF